MAAGPAIASLKNHTVDYDPFLKSQLAFAQLALEPYVVPTWSRYPPKFGGHETLVIKQKAGGHRLGRAAEHGGRPSHRVVEEAAEEVVPCCRGRLRHLLNHGRDEGSGGVTSQSRPVHAPRASNLSI